MRQIFPTDSLARDWEHKVIERMKMCSNPKWLNKGNGQPPPNAWNKGLTKDTDERLANANYNNWNRGLTKDTDERLLKHSELMKSKPSPNKGKQFDDDWKLHLSESHQGNQHTAETKEKMSRTRKGRKHSEEHTAKISESLRGRKLSENHKESLRKGWIKRKQSKGKNNVI